MGSIEQGRRWKEPSPQQPDRVPLLPPAAATAPAPPAPASPPQASAGHPQLSPAAKRLHGGAAAPTSIASLPDDILLLCLAPLPERTAILPGGSGATAGSLSSRGACELVCRRWRRLCLSAFPAAAAIRASPGSAPAAEQAVSAVRLRRVQELRLAGPEDLLPDTWLPLLERTAAQLFPGLQR